MAKKTTAVGSKRTFGTIRELQSGRYQVRYPVDGKLTPAPETFPTRDAAEVFLAGMRTDMNRGTWQPLGESGDSLWDEWKVRWLRSKRGKKAITKLGYEGVVENHVAPFFTGMKIKEITVDTAFEYQDWFLGDRLTVSGKTATTHQKVRNKAEIYASAILDLAATKVPGYTNAFRDPEVPRTSAGGHREVTPIEQDELWALIEAFRWPFGVPVIFDVFTGLRASELWARRMRHLDSLHQTVLVNTSVARVNKVGIVHGPTKNESRRTVPVPDIAKDALDEYLASRGQLGPDDFLFTSARGHMVNHHNYYKKYFQAAIKKAGLRPNIRFHDLRHTYASMLIGDGANAVSVKERMGHSSITVTMDIYGHLFPALEKEVTAKLSARGEAGRETYLARGMAQASPIVPLTWEVG